MPARQAALCPLKHALGAVPLPARVPSTLYASVITPSLPALRAPGAPSACYDVSMLSCRAADRVGGTREAGGVVSPRPAHRQPVFQCRQSLDKIFHRQKSACHIPYSQALSCRVSYRAPVCHPRINGQRHHQQEAPWGTRG